jgi:CHAD domain-containing protein
MKRSRASPSSGKTADSLHDAAIELIERAIHSLKTQRNDEGVHAARKACKRARAALRLMRPSLGSPFYRQQNRRIRDAAKPLTTVRDAFVLTQSRDALQTCPALRRVLMTHYRAQRKTFEAEGRQISLAKLQTSLEQIKVPRSSSSEIASTIAGMRKVYKSGRVAMADAKSRTDETLHEWRKQTKYLLSAFDLLQAVYAVVFKKRRRSANKLAEILGEDHDLAVLATMLYKHRIRDLPLEKEIQKRRRRLQRQARTVGPKLYRMAPRRFERKIARGLAPKLTARSTTWLPG